ncbi:MAG: hypothetical protein II968_03230 [Selenomonadaceae bacterium]|nr:hypothetical protein [Selenomonadaceae bacterium]
MNELVELTIKERRLIEQLRQMTPQEQKSCASMIEQVAQGTVGNLPGGFVNYGSIDKIINVGSKVDLINMYPSAGNA